MKLILTHDFETVRSKYIDVAENTPDISKNMSGGYTASTHTMSSLGKNSTPVSLRRDTGR